MVVAKESSVYFEKLQINRERGTFSCWKSAKFYYESAIENTCMISVYNEHIYLIGGCSLFFKDVDTVSRYEISTDTWKVMPTLNQTRKFTNGCALDGVLYVVGGVIGVDLQVLGSIETFDVKVHDATWKLIQISEPNPLLRGYCVVVPLNHEDIAILGGSNNDGDDLGDIVVYNIKSKTCAIVSEEGPFVFW